MIQYARLRRRAVRRSGPDALYARHRRLVRTLTCAIALVALAALAVPLAAARAAGGNQVAVENGHSGDSAWQSAAERATYDGRLGEDGEVSWRQPPADIYASSPSVSPGGVLRLMVNSPEQFRVVISRLGWYGGTGGRTEVCLPSCNSYQPAAHQPAPPAPARSTGEVQPNWAVTDTLNVPASFVSGYYVATVVTPDTSSTQGAPWTPFIVTAPAAEHSSILVVAPVNTWQAYNDWGGKSLYAFNSTGGAAATEVSFQRPYAEANNHVFGWEYQLVRFLEREGYDVSYSTDLEIDRDPAELARHALVIVDGHDEYWSKSMRDGYDAALAQGTNLVFLGADIGDWQIRYGAGDQSEIEYRSATSDPDTDPASKTTHFADLQPPRPPCRLLGVAYAQDDRNPQHLRDYTVTSAGAANPWMEGTGLRAGDSISNAVGYEWDQVVPGCEVPPLTVLFHWAGAGYGGSPTSADAVTYRESSSGATVFSSGSLQFNWALDAYRGPSGAGTAADPRVQQFMRNVLADLAFAPTRADHFALSISRSGSGEGSVSAGAVSCPGTCSETYRQGTPVTLVAQPASGSSFAGWSGGGCSGTGPCDLTMDADRAVTAEFEPVALHTLTVVLGDASAGSVSGSGISCPGICSGSYPQGTTVTLSAQASPGFVFAGWSGGGCSGTSPCSLTLGSDEVVTAAFQRLPAARCRISVSRRIHLRAVRRRRSQHGTPARSRHAGAFALRITCDQAVSATVRGALTERPRAHNRRAGPRHRYLLGPLAFSVAAGRSRQVNLPMPAAALAGLRLGDRAFLSIELVAENPQGTARATAKRSGFRYP